MNKLNRLLAAAVMGASAALLPAAAARADTLGVQIGPGGVAVQSGDYRGDYRGDFRGRGRLYARPGEVSPGDTVTLIGRDLPPGARLTLAAGRNPARLEAVRSLRSDFSGRIFARVGVPEWARPGRPLFFAIQIPGGGRTLALSQPVQIADDGEGDSQQITVTGELLDPGATCPRLAGDDGRVYALTGSLRQFETGDHVRVTGEISDSSICNQRRTIDIERIREAD